MQNCGFAFSEPIYRYLRLNLCSPSFLDEKLLNPTSSIRCYVVSWVGVHLKKVKIKKSFLNSFFPLEFDTVSCTFPFW